MVGRRGFGEIAAVTPNSGRLTLAELIVRYFWWYRPSLPCIAARDGLAGATFGLNDGW